MIILCRSGSAKLHDAGKSISGSLSLLYHTILEIARDARKNQISLSCSRFPVSPGGETPPLHPALYFLLSTHYSVSRAAGRRPYILLSALHFLRKRRTESYCSTTMRAAVSSTKSANWWKHLSANEADAAQFTIHDNRNAPVRLTCRPGQCLFMRIRL